MTPIPYFGTKKKLVKFYQPPLYDLIMEPFAGAAGYSCVYGLDHDVWINDIYVKIYEVWKWIQNATKKDIEGLPKLKNKGDTLESCKSLSDPERWLLGFATGVGRAQPSNKVTAFAEKRDGTKQIRKALLRLCGRISHWKITNLEYFDMPNKVACWHVDPPYQHLGTHYVHNGKGIDFDFLGKWCLKRKGQLMVCEAAGTKTNKKTDEEVMFEPDWLNDEEGNTLFQPLASGRLKRLQRKDNYVELVYYRSKLNNLL